MKYILLAVSIGPSWLGVVIPAVVFGVAFVATWLLYRHFAKQ
jgi:hypothetical protein